jgi:hypothetical protein
MTRRMKGELLPDLKWVLARGDEFGRWEGAIPLRSCPFCFLHTQ